MKPKKLRYAELYYAITVSAREGDNPRDIRKGRYLYASFQNGREALEFARRLFLGKENRSKVQIEIGKVFPYLIQRGLIPENEGETKT